MYHKQQYVIKMDKRKLVVILSASQIIILVFLLIMSNNRENHTTIIIDSIFKFLTFLVVVCSSIEIFKAIYKKKTINVKFHFTHTEEQKSFYRIIPHVCIIMGFMSLATSNFKYNRYMSLISLSLGSFLLVRGFVAPIGFDDKKLYYLEGVYDFSDIISCIINKNDNSIEFVLKSIKNKINITYKIRVNTPVKMIDEVIDYIKNNDILIEITEDGNPN